MVTLSNIYLYECLSPPEYNVDELISYLQNFYPPVKPSKENDFFVKTTSRFDCDINTLALEIARCRVLDVAKASEGIVPFPQEIDFEKRRLAGKINSKGIIYDGICLQNICRRYLLRNESSISDCRIILTNQLIASFDENDKRYHLRVGIYGIPNIISTSGIIEALARPREFYVKLQLGIDPLVLNKDFGADIINYDDSRLTEILKGYLLQALFYQISGDPFCQDRGCRLYNAHWQKEAIYAQIESGYELCPAHQKMVLSYICCKTEGTRNHQSD
ncbi:MAG: DUF6775 family putative metallopeptidase [Candidatus Omnitrophota bacterium]